MLDLPVCTANYRANQLINRAEPVLLAIPTELDSFQFLCLSRNPGEHSPKWFKLKSISVIPEDEKPGVEPIDCDVVACLTSGHECVFCGVC